jgi:UDP-glucose 4-epimerase
MRRPKNPVPPNTLTRREDMTRKYRAALSYAFAAYAYVGESVADPAMYYRNNLAGSLALLDGDA